MLVALAVAGCDPVATDRADPKVAASTAPTAVATAASAAPAPSPASPAPTPTGPGSQTAAFTAFVDGDTIGTTAGIVRIIGIDTPERGECGHDEASSTIAGLLTAGDSLTLTLPEGQNDRDRYDRLLRHVITADGVDLGLVQLQAGNAIARFDSTDGYPHHPQEAAYHAAQIAEAGTDGAVITTSCQARPQASIAPLTGGQDVAVDAEVPWWRQYSSCTKLKKNALGHPTGPFRAGDPAEADIYNWFAHGTGHRGDGDGDGLACE